MASITATKAPITASMTEPTATVALVMASMRSRTVAMMERGAPEASVMAPMRFVMAFVASVTVPMGAITVAMRFAGAAAASRAVTGRRMARARACIVVEPMAGRAIVVESGAPTAPLVRGFARPRRPELGSFMSLSSDLTGSEDGFVRAIPCNRHQERPSRLDIASGGSSTLFPSCSWGVWPGGADERRRCTVEIAGGLLGLIALILWIIAIISILGAAKSVGWKVLWILVVLLLPIIGTIIYFLVGKST